MYNNHIDIKKKKRYVPYLLFILLIGTALLGSVSGEYELGQFWSKNDNTVVLTNISHNIYIGKNETTTYRLDVNGSINATDYYGDGSTLSNLPVNYPYNQDLNTTNNVKFNDITSIGYFYGDGSKLNNILDNDTNYFNNDGETIYPLNNENLELNGTLTCNSKCIGFFDTFCCQQSLVTATGYQENMQLLSGFVTLHNGSVVGLGVSSYFYGNTLWGSWNISIIVDGSTTPLYVTLGGYPTSGTFDEHTNWDRNDITFHTGSKLTVKFTKQGIPPNMQYVNVNIRVQYDG